MTRSSSSDSLSLTERLNAAEWSELQGRLYSNYRDDATEHAFSMDSALSSVWSWRWCPTSPSDLESVEKRMLKRKRSRKKERRPYKKRSTLAAVQAKTKDQMIDIGDGEIIRTLVVDNGDDNSADVPLVLVHGFGGGVGIWVKNLDALSRNRTVYAFDLLGFGRSSRPNFPPRDADAVEKRFVASIDAWRRELGIERFTLLGHSLGAYLATSYAIAHPSRVEHLILADPWGFPVQPSTTDPVPARVRAFPWWIRGLVRVLDKFSPLAGLRAAGPWGTLPPYDVHYYYYYVGYGV